MGHLKASGLPLAFFVCTPVKKPPFDVVNMLTVHPTDGRDGRIGHMIRYKNNMQTPKPRRNYDIRNIPHLKTGNQLASSFDDSLSDVDHINNFFKLTDQIKSLDSPPSLMFDDATLLAAFMASNKSYDALDELKKIIAYNATFYANSAITQSYNTLVDNVFIAERSEVCRIRRFGDPKQLLDKYFDRFDNLRDKMALTALRIRLYKAVSLSKFTYMMMLNIYKMVAHLNSQEDGKGTSALQNICNKINSKVTDNYDFLKALNDVEEYDNMLLEFIPIGSCPPDSLVQFDRVLLHSFGKDGDQMPSLYLAKQILSTLDSYIDNRVSLLSELQQNSLELYNNNGHNNFIHTQALDSEDLKSLQPILQIISNAIARIYIRYAKRHIDSWHLIQQILSPVRDALTLTIRSINLIDKEMVFTIKPFDHSSINSACSRPYDRYPRILNRMDPFDASSIPPNTNKDNLLQDGFDYITWGSKSLYIHNNSSHYSIYGFDPWRQFVNNCLHNMSVRGISDIDKDIKCYDVGRKSSMIEHSHASYIYQPSLGANNFPSLLKPLMRFNAKGRLKLIEAKSYKVRANPSTFRASISKIIDTVPYELSFHPRNENDLTDLLDRIESSSVIDGKNLLLVFNERSSAHRKDPNESISCFLYDHSNSSWRLNPRMYHRPANTKQFEPLLNFKQVRKTILSTIDYNKPLTIFFNDPLTYSGYGIFPLNVFRRNPIIESLYPTHFNENKCRAIGLFDVLYHNLLNTNLIDNEVSILDILHDEGEDKKSPPKPKSEQNGEADAGKLSGLNYHALANLIPIAVRPIFASSIKAFDFGHQSMFLAARHYLLSKVDGGDREFKMSAHYKTKHEKSLASLYFLISSHLYDKLMNPSNDPGLKVRDLVWTLNPQALPNYVNSKFLPKLRNPESFFNHKSSSRKVPCDKLENENKLFSIIDSYNFTFTKYNQKGNVLQFCLLSSPDPSAKPVDFTINISNKIDVTSCSWSSYNMSFENVLAQLKEESHLVSEHATDMIIADIYIKDMWRIVDICLASPLFNSKKESLPSAGISLANANRNSTSRQFQMHSEVARPSLNAIEAITSYFYGEDVLQTNAPDKTKAKKSPIQSRGKMLWALHDRLYNSDKCDHISNLALTLEGTQSSRSSLSEIAAIGCSLGQFNAATVFNLVCKFLSDNIDSHFLFTPTHKPIDMGNAGYDEPSKETISALESWIFDDLNVEDRDLLIDAFSFRMKFEAFRSFVLNAMAEKIGEHDSVDGSLQKFFRYNEHLTYPQLTIQDMERFSDPKYLKKNFDREHCLDDDLLITNALWLCAKFSSSINVISAAKVANERSLKAFKSDKFLYDDIYCPFS